MPIALRSPHPFPVPTWAFGRSSETVDSKPRRQNLIRLARSDAQASLATKEDENMAQAQLTNFRITGLRGQKTVDVGIADNTLVLVGENGSGKTTILRALFYYLSGRWGQLKTLNFSEIAVTINGQVYNLQSRDIPDLGTTIDREYVRALPPTMRRRFNALENQGRFEEAEAVVKTYFGNHLSIGYRGSSAPSAFKDLLSLQQTMAEAIGAQILYLPTYRRIERELTSIFSGIDTDDLRKFAEVQAEDGAFIELVEFGMADVQRAIKKALEDIRSYANTALNSLTLTYLGDVVSKNYQSDLTDDVMLTNEETVSSVLNRISPTILRDDQKSELLSIVMNAKASSDVRTEHERIIFHYLSKLLRFQADLQSQEKNVRAFCDLTSKYITDKKFVYDTQRFSFRIEWSSRSGNRPVPYADPVLPNEKAGDIGLADLSSGEKQIVSLFSHLYLSGHDKYFVLIDEPELSLSVPWQRRFLEDIRAGSFCAGLVAVTHSPFIYDNSLKANAHALGEFVRGPDWGYLQ